MAKKETLILNEDYEYPKLSNVKIEYDSLYKEEASVVRREIFLDVTLSPKGQLKEIDKHLDIIKTKMKTILLDFLYLKLYKHAAKHDSNYKLELALVEKYINKFRIEIDYINKIIVHASKKSDLNIEEIKEILDRVEILFGGHNGLRNELIEFKKKYYHEFKLSSYAITRNKNIEELEDLILNVENELKNFKTIEEAHDYYCYNSGVLVNEVIESIIKLKGNLNYHYFISQDAVIVLKYNEWIELFVKFNYVLSKINKSSIPVEFIKKFEILEIRYTIMSIYNEMRRQ